MQAWKKAISATLHQALIHEVAYLRAAVPFERIGSCLNKDIHTESPFPTYCGHINHQIDNALGLSWGGRPTDIGLAEQEFSDPETLVGVFREMHFELQSRFAFARAEPVGDLLMQARPRNRVCQYCD